MTSPYLTTREAAIYLRFVDAEGRPSVQRCLKFLYAHAVRTRKRGASVLVHRDDLEAALRGSEGR